LSNVKVKFYAKLGSLVNQINSYQFLWKICPLRNPVKFERLGQEALNEIKPFFILWLFLQKNQDL
jgi:hypothetical protein